MLLEGERDAAAQVVIKQERQMMHVYGTEVSEICGRNTIFVIWFVNMSPHLRTFACKGVFHSRKNQNESDAVKTAHIDHYTILNT